MEYPLKLKHYYKADWYLKIRHFHPFFFTQTNMHERLPINMTLDEFETFYYQVLSNYGNIYGYTEPEFVQRVVQEFRKKGEFTFIINWSWNAIKTREFSYQIHCRSYFIDFSSKWIIPLKICWILFRPSVCTSLVKHLKSLDA